LKETIQKYTRTEYLSIYVQSSLCRRLYRTDSDCNVSSVFSLHSLLQLSVAVQEADWCNG